MPSLLQLFLLVLVADSAVLAQAPASERNVPRPGTKEVQVPFASLRPSATFRIGGTADWVLVTEDAVWVAGTKPYSVQRIDPRTNRIVAKVRLLGEACSGIEFGFGSVWVPLCGKRPALVRISALTNRITATLPLAPAGAEGGIAASGDSVWMVTDKNGTLSRIDPATNKIRQTISISGGSYNPLFADGIIWVTGFENNVLTAVDASSGSVVASIAVGPKPRFLTTGASSIWTLNQGDGTVSRVDENGRKVMATVQVGIPGTGGDICFGEDSVWATVFDVPLTRISAKTDKVSRQWIGRGGDSLRLGHGSIWLTDYHRGLLWRFPVNQLEGP
jgi:virginiamycin B lyase